MSIRTTVALDDDVLASVKAESRCRGTTFRTTVNDLLRLALMRVNLQPERPKFVVRATNMGYYPGLNYDCTESLIEYLEGVYHR
ncbi:MAG: hypothetical protein M3Y27_22870 [Acidobacteriota bacterium]|nr:hypothetical protein [Acidobacteriota bacterium]